MVKPMKRIQVVVYSDEDGVIRTAFVVPSTNPNTHGVEIVSNGFVNGEFRQPFTISSSANWIANFHIDLDNVEWLNLDCSDVKNIKTLCAR